MVYVQVVLQGVGSWTPWSLWVTSNLRHSMMCLNMHIHIHTSICIIRRVYKVWAHKHASNMSCQYCSHYRHDWRTLHRAYLVVLLVRQTQHQGYYATHFFPLCRWQKGVQGKLDRSKCIQPHLSFSLDLEPYPVSSQRLPSKHSYICRSG